MPLSDEELRLLEQMERALSEEDPKFASTLRGTSLRRSARRRAMAACFVFAIGVVVLMTGAITQLWYVGVIGFLLMLGSATVGLGAIRGRNAAAATPDPRVTGHPSGFTVVEGGRSSRRDRGPRAGRPPRSRTPSGGFMARVEQRWRRRREQGGM